MKKDSLKRLPFGLVGAFLGLFLGRKLYPEGGLAKDALIIVGAVTGVFVGLWIFPRDKAGKA